MNKPILCIFSLALPWAVLAACGSDSSSPAAAPAEAGPGGPGGPEGGSDGGTQQPDTNSAETSVPSDGPAEAKPDAAPIDWSKKPRAIMASTSGVLEMIVLDPKTGLAIGAQGYTGVVGATMIAAASSYEFFFVPNSSANSMSVYAEETPPTGSPHLVDQDPNTPGIQYYPITQPTFACVHPTLSRVYATTSTGTLTALSFDAKGIVSQPVVVAAGTNPTACAVDPAGKFVFVALTGDDKIATFKLDASGSPQGAAQTTAAAAGPLVMATHPTLPVFYVVSGKAITAFSYDGNGALSSLGELPTGQAATPQSYGLAIHPSGSYLWVTNFQDTLINSFAMNATTGALTAGPTTTVPSGNSAPAVDPSGTWMYVANEDGKLRVYTVNAATGALTLKDDMHGGAARSFQNVFDVWGP